jgi:hypothetical protein
VIDQLSLFVASPADRPGAHAARLARLAIEAADREPGPRERLSIEDALAEQRGELRARCQHAAGCRCPRPLPGAPDEDGDRTCLHCGRRVVA